MRFHIIRIPKLPFGIAWNWRCRVQHGRGESLLESWAASELNNFKELPLCLYKAWMAGAHASFWMTYQRQINLRLSSSQSAPFVWSHCFYRSKFTAQTPAGNVCIPNCLDALRASRQEKFASRKIGQLPLLFQRKYYLCTFKSRKKTCKTDVRWFTLLFADRGY